MKVCTKCSKSDGPFQKDKTRKDGLHPWCNSCKNVGATVRGRRSHLKIKYHMTETEWEIKFESQGRRCAICETTEPGKKGWTNDHDHKSGNNRSILCGLCNAGLGCLKDSPELLRKAADYLEGWRDEGRKISSVA